jgi:Thaumatin family
MPRHAIVSALLAAALAAGSAHAVCPPGTRAITLVNRCGETIWAGAVGNRGNTTGGAKTCTANAQCGPNEYCDLAITKQCTFVPADATVSGSGAACTTNGDCPASEFCYTLTNKCIALPADGNGWELTDATPREVCVPTPWQGRFWPRSACAFSSGKCAAGVECCQTGNCLGEDNKTFSFACRLSAVPPATLAEAALLEFPGQDTYDVSNVDGFSRPVEISPTPGTYDATQPAGTFYEPWCGRPGCPSDCGATAACPWKLDVTVCPEQMRFVVPQTCATKADCPTAASDCNKAGICTCATDADCSDGQVCGTSPLDGGSRTCGPYAGCYSAAKACGAAPTLGAPLDCAQHTALYGCTGAVYGGSCYTAGASNDCCGCASWSPPDTCAGGASNAAWVKLAETDALPPSPVGFAKTFHDACPTAYSFPYDDKVSTFNCKGLSAEKQAGYTITFCPGGIRGGSGCTSAADCTDDDPCTVETCGPGSSCVATPAEGYAAADCVCDEDPPSACADGFPRPVARKHKQACRRLAKGDRGKKARIRKKHERRALVQAAKQFRQAEKLARKLRKRKKVDEACGDALIAAMAAARERAVQAKRNL